MNLDWFEMKDLKRHTFNNKVWIPLYAQTQIAESGETGHVGYREEYFGAHSVIVPVDQQAAALELEWMDLDAGFGHKPWIDGDDKFHAAADFLENEVHATHPVLVQTIEVERRNDLHINQDIILALGLVREDDVWVCPEEDYVEVIKLERNKDDEPTKVEIKAEFLKDYLCASNSGLLLLTYQSRRAIEESFDDVEWEDGEASEENKAFRWEGRVQEAFEGNSLIDILGAAVVSHAWRTDTDYDEDIPKYDFPTNDTSASETYTVRSANRKVQRAAGQIWKSEWIEPATRSPRVRRDKVESKLEFIVDNEGNRETSETLSGPSRWLWFHPNVINELLKKRTGTLSWYSENTGNVGGAWNRSVHFGVNSVGLINVYAKDIAQMREVDKKIWANHNVSPEGKVSAELLMSQMEANPADTVAPEQDFFTLINEIQEISRAKLGNGLFREHSSEQAISRKIHRFQATSLDGFYLLCKEITRFLIERIDIDFLKTLRKEDDKLGSLKRVEKILRALEYDGRAIMGVLVGVYELRLADAHLPSTDNIKDAMTLVGIDYEALRLLSGKKLIQNVNDSLAQIEEAFDKGDFTKL